MTVVAAACIMAGMASAQEPIVAIKASPMNIAFKNSAFNKPIVVKSKEEATKLFGKEAVATLVKAVDFKKQFVLVFAWRGSGGDRLNYTVADLDAMIATLQAKNVQFLDKKEVTDYGDFIHLLGPENHKIELWQPPLFDSF